jgi:uncharacterized protein (UPF0335 family)
MANIINGIDGTELAKIVEAYETQSETVKSEQEAAKEILSNAKSKGYDPKLIKKVVALKKKDASKREQEDLELAVYMKALNL